jgi:glyoxylate/hydroxypyruvate reductase
MRTLLVYTGRSSGDWRDRLAAAAPEFDWLAWSPDIALPAIDGFVGWNPPAGLFARMPGLQAAFALGAGVDGFLKREDFPASIPLLRLRDAGMAEQMVEYALLGVLHWQRHVPTYAAQQREARWRQLPARGRADTRVGVLGLGYMGGTVAQALAGFGYAVEGWSRTPRELPGVVCRHGDAALLSLLARCDVLISMLPSTPDTRGLLDAAKLGVLPDGAFVVNAARGDQIVIPDLVTQLDSGHLSGALLDVFPTEPLPPDDPLWRHPKLIATPHVAALTVPGPAVEQVVENLRRFVRGEVLLGRVDRARGY